MAVVADRGCCRRQSPAYTKTISVSEISIVFTCDQLLDGTLHKTTHLPSNARSSTANSASSSAVRRSHRSMTLSVCHQCWRPVHTTNHRHSRTVVCMCAASLCYWPSAVVLRVERHRAEQAACRPSLSTDLMSYSIDVAIVFETHLKAKTASSPCQAMYCYIVIKSEWKVGRRDVRTWHLADGVCHQRRQTLPATLGVCLRHVCRRIVSSTEVAACTRLTSRPHQERVKLTCFYPASPIVLVSDFNQLPDNAIAEWTSLAFHSSSSNRPEAPCGRRLWLVTKAH